MDDDCGIDSGHVFMGLGEYIFVLFKKVDELVSEASRQLWSNLDLTLGVLVI